MYGPQTRQKIEAELAQAQSARESGNEGRARVCARRAAGFAIAEYLLLTGKSPAPASATDLLALFQTLPAVPADLKEIARLLLVRVNTDYQFPLPVDLLDETRNFITSLDALSQ